MDLLDTASNINKTHQGCISTLEGSSVFFLGMHLSTRGALHAFLGGASRRARGSGFSVKFFNMEYSRAGCPRGTPPKRAGALLSQTWTLRGVLFFTNLGAPEP